MITRPFDFCSQLRRPGNHIEALPFIDACLILICFTLLGSNFVLAPGISVSLPRTAGSPPDLAPASRVLSVSEAQGGNEMLIFDGQIFRLDALEAYLADGRRAEPNESFLIQFDRDVSMDVFSRVSEIAGAAGFSRIQVAAESGRRTTPD